MIRLGSDLAPDSLNDPRTLTWTAMILDIVGRLPANFERVQALASALGDATDNTPEPQRKFAVQYVRNRLPEWLLAGLREPSL
jgi:hypothetical protein